MGKNLTTAQKLEIIKPALKTRILVTIELDDGPFRILANDTIANIVVGSNTYYTRTVRTSGIQTSLDGTTDNMVISISDIDQEFAAHVATNGDVLTSKACKVEEVIFDGDTNTILGNPILVFEGVVNKIQLNATSFVFTVERILNNYSSLSPNMVYDVNCQFKFKSGKCGYTGAATKCDKTLSRCKALNNVTNFGGYPSVVIPTTTK